MSRSVADENPLPLNKARAERDGIPKAILALLLMLWSGLGLWIVRNMPFGAGTDESIRYVAFAAAKNRWATEEDFHRYAIDHFYYPPLYYLMFAPLWGDEPSFVEGFPDVTMINPDPNYANFAGRRTVSTSRPPRVPPPLIRLNRQAKLFSLGLGLVVLLVLAATLRLLFPDPAGWWKVLLGTTPLIFLPQFLYYQALVNNDTLLNALSALATFAFTAAVLALERGRERRFYALSLAMAVCIGLAFLTKMSAPVLIPLALGLAWTRFAADRGLAWKTRTRRALLLLALLAVVIVVAGGWWAGYKALQGDWNGFKAHRLAHPWAAADLGRYISPAWWVSQIVLIVRSYYALFSGMLFISVPDLVFLAWFSLPVAILGCAVVLAVARIRSGKPLQPAGLAERRFRTVIWGTFAGVIFLNVASVLMALRFFQVAYGRLLFPSLVAMHALATAIVARTLRGRRRALVAVTLVLAAYTGLLFGWTFRHRLAQAATQPPEDVRVLTGSGVGSKYIGPVWLFTVAQELNIPPGDLAAVRVALWRENIIPQFGAALEGSLTLRSAQGQEQEIRVRRTALGDNDLCTAWAELELERTIRLTETTTALLSLRGLPPAWLPGRNKFEYRCSDTGFPARMNGAVVPCALCVAAVYRP